MKKTRTIVCSIFLMLFITSILPFAVFAQEVDSSSGGKTYEIYSVEDLRKIASDPYGSYMLMVDLDLYEYPWTAVDFYGEFNGNGHAILNLSVVESSDITMQTFDGNRIGYDSYGVGLFGCISGAQIRDLQLINVRSVYEADYPCFLGAIAGISEDSLISGCKVSGELELRAHDRMFGVGGIVGYGYGTMENCEADVTLICVDTDTQNRDEQFMGGAYSAGFFNVLNSIIKIDGYDSEHGYAHNGGLTGMYMHYPIGVMRDGHISGNFVEGKISFYEDNTDRRAYCKAIIGEVLDYRSEEPGNHSDFIRDESYDYSLELRPEMCDAPEYSVSVVPGLCTEFGYEEYTCNTCGYTYRDHYTLPVHTITRWEVAKAATVEEEGVSIGKCDLCGAAAERIEEKIEPTQPKATEAETTPLVTIPEEKDQLSKINVLPYIVVVLIAILALALIFGMILDSKRWKK